MSRHIIKPAKDLDIGDSVLNLGMIESLINYGHAVEVKFDTGDKRLYSANRTIAVDLPELR